MKWSSIKFYLAAIVLLNFAGYSIGISIRLTAGIYNNVIGLLEARFSEKHRPNPPDWIIAEFSEDFYQDSWETFASFYGVSPKIKRPPVFLNYSKNDSECFPFYCVLGEYSAVTGAVVLYPYRLAYASLGFYPRMSTFEQDRRAFRAYAETKLTHEYTHYLHDVNLIPMNKSHCAMYGDALRVGTLIRIISEKHDTLLFNLLNDEMLYLRSASEPCRKEIE